jgi:hypothetical protein
MTTRIPRSVAHCCLMVFLVLVLLPRPADAQAVTGTLLGVVADTTGGVLPGATVTITHVATGLVRTVVAGTDGAYTAPSLPTGVYTVSASLQGFKTVALSNIHIGVDQRVRIDLGLEVGNMTEAVTVEAVTPLVQTASSDLSATVDDVQMQTLPLNGRNFVQLTRTLPGVLRGIPGANIDGSGSYAWRMSASFSANGQRTRDNNFMLDGVDNNETWLNSVVVFPSVDAIEEFKVQTSTYSAEFGRSSGGVVNIQIKSGSNEFHGNAFEFMRDDKLDANDFFNNKFGRAKPPFRQDQFGGTLGGPILRGKTFFFGDYQGWRITEGRTYLSTVPTERMRNGDFSEINRQIYDPLTGLPFPGNVIPPSRFDRAAKNIMDQLYPAPNVAGTRGSNGQFINNYLINPTLERQDDQFDIKIDHALTEGNRFFGRYSYQRTHRFLPATLPHGDANFTFGAGDGLIKAQSFAFNDTHVFNSRWLNEFRVGWNAITFDVSPIDFGQNLADQMGIPGVNIGATSSAMTQIQFAPAQEIRHLGSNNNQPLFTRLGTLQFFDNVTHTRGRHALKAGASLTFRSREVFNIDRITGQYIFQSALTSNCGGRATGCTIDPNTGFSVASFLLGYATTVNRENQEGTFEERKPELGAYIQDDIRMSDKLTVNLGLRYDLFVPYVEIEDRQSNFDTSTGRFVVASENATLNGIEVGRYLQTYSKLDFAPRLGFAYDLFGSGRTVVRGGFGMFWNNPLTGTSSSKAINPPFLLSQSQSTTLVPTVRLSDGLPPPPTVDPNRPAAGATRSIFDPNFRDGYAQQWNLNFQQQFGRNYAMEAAYVGSRGRQLVVKVDINQAPPVIGVTNSDINRPFIGVAPLVRGLSRSESRGELDHHGFLFKFTRRLADGFSFVNSYTYGSTIDTVSDTEQAWLNAYDADYNRGPAAYDVTHTFTSTWIYQLPFGHGQRFASSVASLTDKFIGGWQLSGILQTRSGLPFTVLQSQNLLSTGTGNRPDRIGSGTLDNPTIDRWFDTSAFVPTRDNTGTYGNSGRNILRGPGEFVVDLSLIKVTRIGRFEPEFRIEAFNAFNQPQFARPTGFSTDGAGATIGNASAGVISSLEFNRPMRQIQLVGKVRF